ncbi:MAG: fumarylacetoacetase [Sphingobacteriales bacterium JAD_PAG50586_3]|nr:MAG: fumarylacetoacetase [Sphingobacteriales bacterium JAD_PAG50586_3]
MKSWIEIPANSDFSIHNIPFGVYKSAHGPRVATAIGGYVVDLFQINAAGLLGHFNIPSEVFKSAYLNDFISLGKVMTNGVRNRLQELFSEGNTELKENEALRNAAMLPINGVEMMLPVHIGDYTDFYSSEDHATNVGKMFRDPANALLPNWKHLPVGYHGRSSSIVISGTPIHRPKGQTKLDTEEVPTFGPSKRLDFELEMAFIIGKETQLGDSITTAHADDHIFGMVIFNDWSARDIQKWEYVPLGPFLAKNFGSSISPWVVTLEALEPFRTKGAEQDPKVLPYLEYQGEKNIDINLEVLLTPPSAEESTISRSNYKYMYWTMEQQLAHHTVNGCNVRVGDMMASGTISGPEETSFGSMLELSWGGKNTLHLNGGVERKFIEDNDTVTMRAYSEKNGIRVGFGEVVTTILPAK